MSRRSRRKKTSSKKSSANLTPVIVGILAAILVAGGGYLFLKSRGGGEVSTGKLLPLDTYETEAHTLGGNTYDVVGEIVSRHKELESDDQRVYELLAENNDQKLKVIIVVPKKVMDKKNINIATKDRYIYTCKVGENGILDVLDIRRE